MIANTHPFGATVAPLFEVQRTNSELNELAKLLKRLDGECRLVMESTGNYHAPVIWLLHNAGVNVSNRVTLASDYGNNSLRRYEADKKAAVKLANYVFDHYIMLARYVSECYTRQLLQNFHRQYQQYSKVQTILKMI